MLRLIPSRQVACDLLGLLELTDSPHPPSLPDRAHAPPGVLLEVSWGANKPASSETPKEP